MLPLYKEIEELKGLLAPSWSYHELRALASGPVALKTNNGIDMVAFAVGLGLPATLPAASATAAATATSATSLTNASAAFPASSGGPPATGGLVGCVVVAATAYGIVVSNTATVLTIDMWHTFGAPNTVAATPGATATYYIAPGQSPAYWLGLSINATAPVATDSTLAGELWNASGGLNRILATTAHSVGTATYTVSNTFTANTNDGSSNQIQKIGIFQHQVKAAPTTSTSGIMLYETAVPSPPTLVSGDTLTVTDTVTIS